MPLHAYAADLHVIYSGTVTDGFDTDNVFGLSGQSLAGFSLTADITYSTSVPGTRTTTVSSDEVFGGLAFGTDAVISSAVFMLGATSFTLSPTYYGDVYTSAGFLNAYGYDVLGNNFQTYIFPDSAAPANLETPFHSTGVGDTGGLFSQFSYLIAGNDVIDFDATSVSVPAVPEPATWAMMLTGFAGMGCAIRRRNKGLTDRLIA